MNRREFLKTAAAAAGGLGVAASGAVVLTRSGSAATAPSGSPAKGASSTSKTRKSAPGSRQWIERAMDVVRADKPTPPAQARLYACVADTYERAIKAGANAAEAGEVVRQVLAQTVPGHASEWAVAKAPRLSARVGAVTAAAVRLMTTDGFLPDDPVRDMANAPTGPGYWIRRNNAGPLAVSAGSWRRWAIPAREFPVAAPIRPGDPLYESQKQAVIEATARRDADWTAKINFWGGVPGTEGPSGIWLNRLWTVTQDERIASTDATYAVVQSRMARAVADAFMECWKIKYTYWTERPDMAVPGLVTAMANPPFPGYLSGHSTISAAAGTVLASLVPAHASLWIADAETARDSRLYAGIHFPMDNENGFALGVEVGNVALSNFSK